MRTENDPSDSNYVQPDPYRNDGLREVECPRCKGTGEDRRGDYCLNCDGDGTLILAWAPPPPPA